MVFSKILPKPQNSDLAKTYAIFSVLFLIFIAFVVSLFLAFGLQLIVSLVVGQETSESIKTAISVLIGLITTGFLAFVSWDMVAQMVSSAIQAAVDEFKEDYEKTQTSESIINRQNLELSCVVYQILNQELNFFSPTMFEKSPHEVSHRRAARDAIIKGFAYDKDFLLDYALAATDKSIKNENDKTKRTLFRHNIYVYLRAWLMLSVANERGMPIEFIKQQYPNEQNPDWEAYNRALEDVKDRLLKLMVEEKIESIYQEEAIKILRQYLSILITALKDVNNT